jgi:hypothetical protein
MSDKQSHTPMQSKLVHAKFPLDMGNIPVCGLYVFVHLEPKQTVKGKRAKIGHMLNWRNIIPKTNWGVDV